MRKKNALITLPIALLAAWLVCPPAVQAASGWIVYGDGSYHGKVIDTETKEPIEGAVIVATYHVSCYRIVQQNSKEVGVQETLTQADGTFRIPSFWTITTPECWASYTDFVVFKPGYGTFPYSGPLGEGQTQDPSSLYSRTNIYSSDSRKLQHIQNLTRKNIQDIFKTGSIVELPRLETIQELRQNFPSEPVSSERLRTKIKKFFKLVNEQRKELGYEPIGPQG